MKSHLRRIPVHLPSKQGYLGFRVIGIYKLVTGVLALIAGVAFVRFVKGDPALAFAQLIEHLGLDRNNQLVNRIISTLTGIDRSRLHAMEAGTFFFAALRLVEGIGLVLERDWAGYLRPSRSVRAESIVTERWSSSEEWAQHKKRPDLAPHSIEARDWCSSTSPCSGRVLVGTLIFKA